MAQVMGTRIYSTQYRWFGSSLADAGARLFSFGCGTARRCPKVFCKVHAALENANAFAFQQPLLERGMRLAQENTSSGADHAVPWNPQAGRTCGHRASCRARTPTQLEQFSQLPIGDYTAARDLFHQVVNRPPGHLRLPNSSFWNKDLEKRGAMPEGNFCRTMGKKSVYLQGTVRGNSERI